MIITGLVLAALAALVHVYIFYLESIAWTSPRALETFGQTRADAEAQKTLAFNQGFYNLFLAIVTVLGVVAFALGFSDIGATLVFAGAGSMLAASLVLLISSRDRTAAALKQGVVPSLAVIALAVGLAL